jgi:hypothetical protein
MFLFQGFEALVFAGSGALFGTTVQRQQAVRAANDAERARAEANAERAKAENMSQLAMHGEALATMTKAKRDRARSAGNADAAAGPGVRGARPDLAAGATGAGLEDLDELAALAERFFPSS